MQEAFMDARLLVADSKTLLTESSVGRFKISPMHPPGMRNDQHDGSKEIGIIQMG